MGLLLLIVFALLIAALARHRGRSGIIWACMSVLITPLGALLLLLLLRSKRPSPLQVTIQLLQQMPRRRW